MGILTCLLFTIAVRAQALGMRINIVEWDMNIVTANDYSVELPIDKDGYNDWFENKFHGEGGDYSKNVSPGLSLKRHIMQVVEDVLTEEMTAYYQMQETEVSEGGTVHRNILKRDTLVRTQLSKIKIADLTFGREN